jgi:hypothetical protein
VFRKQILSTADQVHLLGTGRRETAGRRTLKPSIRRDDGPSQQESMMKNLILAAIATLSLGIGVASAQSLSHSAPPAQHSTPNYTVGGDGAAG